MKKKVKTTSHQTVRYELIESDILDVLREVWGIDVPNRILDGSVRIYVAPRMTPQVGTACPDVSVRGVVTDYTPLVVEWRETAESEGTEVPIVKKVEGKQ